MRTLDEIIESAKDGNMPTHEECYWAMLVYESMLNIDHQQLQEALLPKRVPEFIRKEKANNSFNMYKNALNKSPKEFMGPNNDPSSAAYQKMRQMGKRILENFLKGK
jgi:hypothetical protein